MTVLLHANGVVALYALQRSRIHTFRQIIHDRSTQRKSNHYRSLRFFTASIPPLLQSKTLTATPFHSIWSLSHQTPSSMPISDEKWTVAVEKFGNPTSFVFHWANLKLKYDLG
ncbi:hypothetical protein AVEN_29815-1 [Araneus ventricosus]|uniref:Uncharacterized protein n=1 Tax=Araneus ventricosus TaxID=182803 RepID=A0A4Y2JXU2_ARAVE|nr:hypothetical protein AVEN_29815-1 [Araneus ventricosus]